MYHDCREDETLLRAQEQREGVTHTGDGGEDFRYPKTNSDVADLVFWYTCLQEDVKRESTDLGKREALI